MFGPRVEDCEILLETLHQQFDLSVGTHDRRRAVVDDFGRTAHLIDQHDALRLHIREIVHHVVTIGHHPLAETAGVDAEDQVDRLVEIGGTAQVVSHDDGHLFTADGDRLAAAPRNEKSHFTACRDKTLAYATLDLAMLDDGSCAHRTAFGQHGNAHHGRDTAAMRSDLVQRLLAKFDKRRFTQQVHGGSSAECLFGEDDEIGAFGLGSLDGVDDFRLVPFNVADRIIKLSKSDFHLSGILIF